MGILFTLKYGHTAAITTGNDTRGIERCHCDRRMKPATVFQMMGKSLFKQVLKCNFVPQSFDERKKERNAASDFNVTS